MEPPSHHFTGSVDVGASRTLGPGHCLAMPAATGLFTLVLGSDRASLPPSRGLDQPTTLGDSCQHLRTHTHALGHFSALSTRSLQASQLGMQIFGVQHSALEKQGMRTVTIHN